MAAIEFAMIVPIMAVMFIGAVELSQAITVDRRVTQIASSTADLVAQRRDTISQTEITDIMRVGSYIMAPYSQNPLQIVHAQRPVIADQRDHGQAIVDVHLQRHRQHADLRLHQSTAYRCRPTW